MAEVKRQKTETPLQKKIGFKSQSYSWFDFHAWVQWLWGWGIPRPLFLGALFLGLLNILSTQIPNFLVFGFGWVLGTAPIWLPLVLISAGWQTWVRYIRSAWISEREGTLLEIRIPREMSKSPRAMEIALATMWSTSGETDFIKRAWMGRVRPWYSLEIASFGGEVHFYVWTWDFLRNVVETALYAQFPDVEIHVVEDYASKFQYDPARYDGFVNDFKLSKEDVFPIKSYIDFELDKDPKEEFKIEPLAQMFEYLSGLKPQEQVWIQIIIRATKTTGGVLFPTSSEADWQARQKKKIDEIRVEAIPDEQKDNPMRFPNPTWKQKVQMEAIERNSGKVSYDVSVRGIYMADLSRGSVQGPNIGILRLIWKPLGTSYLNELGPDNDGGLNTFNYPWQDYKDMYKKFIMRRFLDAYRRRSAFYPPWSAPIGIMSVESIATLWHFPSSTVQAPGINRIPATKAAPPPNLPM
ncbi:hypothetical protein FJY93_02540 [Candidatus Kaiserbacteria bacterium]|nr:hypothetical protein [Candidatus Kaiserbacteria bacterium]